MQYKYQENLLTHWLPNGLIEAQKRGELLIFCGAGVSMREGLPGFRELVTNLAEEVFDLKVTESDTCSYTGKRKLEYLRNGNSDQRFSNLMQNGSFDRAINYLENLGSDYINSRKSIIDFVKKKLIEQKFLNDADLGRHKAILELASSDHGVRLVTTNFDNLFERAKKELTNHSDIELYNAPLIPPADPHRWSGIIKIHGSLDILRTTQKFKIPYNDGYLQI